MVQELSPARARELISAEALSRVPGYSPAAGITALAGGAVNGTFRLETRAGQSVRRWNPRADPGRLTSLKKRLECCMTVLRVVDRDGIEHEVEAQTGIKVMETLRELDYGVAAICGGMCSCATCHVYVDADWMMKLPAAMSDERELLTELTRYEPERSRLSCQIEFTADFAGLRVTIAPDE